MISITRQLARVRITSHRPRCARRIGQNRISMRYSATKSFSRHDEVKNTSVSRISKEMKTARHFGTGLVPPPATPPFAKILAANRGEIAIRIMRAGTELGAKTVGIFAHEDRYCPHRYKADQAFQVGKDSSPVGAYLHIEDIVQVAKENGVEAIHPGYGFLSENATFAEACERNNITFVGPSSKHLRMFGDKTSARELAVKAGIPVIPGTGSIKANDKEVKDFVAKHGCPVIIKAVHGGGGRGMRVVRSEDELEDALKSAESEAKAAFGDGTLFVEKLIERPRHIEVQIFGDKNGDVIHLYERDCSVQRRHQKVVESAPAVNLAPETRAKICEDAVHLARTAKYENAGTVEFLVDEDGKHYFIEVNPRVQVEHTVTEEVTGVDIVQTQIRIASGESLKEMGLTQDKIDLNGYAIQCRITTEDPEHNFQPDSGVISVYRSATGPGIRLDDGPGYTGALITPFYDSLLVKVTAHSSSFAAASAKLTRALREYRIRGVSTNKPFLLNVLKHPEFLSGSATTKFIEEHPEVLKIRSDALNRGEKLLRYLAEVSVNGPEQTLGATGPAPEPEEPKVPHLPMPSASPASSRPLRLPVASMETLKELENRSQSTSAPSESLRSIFKRNGADAFAKAVRNHPGLLLTDTTWRDAHQSLLATRVRTTDIMAIAPATAETLQNAFSIENWGGATFDVAMRFLRECPWDRLAQMREAVPDIPFQMLLRGANGVGYTSYPDNAVFKFCEEAVKNGMDVFRVFDSVNYEENLKLGVEAVGAAGGIIEGAICYTGDVLQSGKNKYNMEYYLTLARSLVEMGTHVLAIKDMAGLLKPDAAYELVSALRREFPEVPIHVHTHDTAGTGVASMLAAAAGGADAVDGAIDSMSGMTSQPSLGAIVHALRGTALDTQIDPVKLAIVNDYWEAVRGVYAPFESGQKAGSSDVYLHEMPGGQYTNLMYQTKQLGLTGRWPEVKKAYAAANRLLGGPDGLIKVTPSSKVVGDLASFMVTNGLSESDVLEQADTLQFPTSVVQFFQGYLGIPPGGFPEPFRSQVVKNSTLASGQSTFEGRPGAELPPLDLAKIRHEMEEKYGKGAVRDVDIMSYVMYPDVYDDWRRFAEVYGDTSVIPTRQFISPMKEDDEISFEIEKGKTLFIRLKTIGTADKDGYRDVIFELNGESRTVRVRDKSSVEATQTSQQRVADKNNENHISASMPGVIVQVNVKQGDNVEEGQVLAVLSAMKMETAVRARRAGSVGSIYANVGQSMKAGDLLMELQ